MEIKNKLSELLAQEEKLVAELSSKRQTIQSTIEGFRASVAAVNGNTSSETSAFRRKLESRIAEESEHLKSIETKIVDATAKKTAFSEAIKILSKTSNGSHKELRANTELAKVRDLIRKAGKPLPLNEILLGLGKVNDEKKRISLRGSLRNYANNHRVFTLGESPDTFGLIEFKE